jgi:hypothetical protein
VRRDIAGATFVAPAPDEEVDDAEEDEAIDDPWTLHLFKPNRFHWPDKVG